MDIAIIDYGAGNIQSVLFALQRLGFNGNLTNDPEKIRIAYKVIFPGVGSAGSAMEKLRQSGLDTLIPTLKQPVLGICLGMQLMCRFTQENTTKGLGIFDTDVLKFSGGVKVPQVGWNSICNLKTGLFDGVSENEFMYMVHSYYVPTNPNCIATTDYGIEYASALQKDNFYGVQFHPEKSGFVGEKILSNFLNLTL